MLSSAYTTMPHSVHLSLNLAQPAPTFAASENGISKGKGCSIMYTWGRYFWSLARKSIANSGSHEQFASIATVLRPATSRPSASSAEKTSSAFSASLSSLNLRNWVFPDP